VRRERRGYQCFGVVVSRIIEIARAAKDQPLVRRPPHGIYLSPEHRGLDFIVVKFD
jgi:hypothetical protein